MTLKKLLAQNLFNVALSILFSPPPTTPTFDVALQVCVCVCMCVCVIISFILFLVQFFLLT